MKIYTGRSLPLVTFWKLPALPPKATRIRLNRVRDSQRMNISEGPAFTPACYIPIRISPRDTVRYTKCIISEQNLKKIDRGIVRFSPNRAVGGLRRGARARVSWNLFTFLARICFFAFIHRRMGGVWHKNLFTARTFLHVCDTVSDIVS